MSTGGNWWWQNSPALLGSIPGTPTVSAGSNWWWQNTPAILLAAPVDSAVHGHTADTAPVVIEPHDTEHGHEAEEPVEAVEVHSAVHGHLTEASGAVIAPHGAVHSHLAALGKVVIDVEDSVHLHTVDVAEFTGAVPVHSATHGHLAQMADIVGLLKWSTESIAAGDVLPYPVTLVEVAKNPATLDPSRPAPGKYKGIVLRHPEVSEDTTESAFGIRTKEDVNLALSNAGKVFKVDGGTDYSGWTVRIWRRHQGVNELRFRGKFSGLRIGHEAGVLCRDEVRQALLDTIPHRFVTTAMYPNGAKDVGKAISIASGRVARIPCPNIEWDDLNRIYRYQLGEGEGYGGENWQDVTRAYRVAVAFKHLTGTVSAATSTSLTVQSADGRPPGFLRWFWAEITGGLGAGQIRPVTAHTQERVVNVSPAWSPTPNTSSTYRLREWRWYSGAQVTPYPGIAFLEFRKQILDGSSIATVYADGEALPGETNFVRMIQSVLSNTTWGKGLQVAQGAFDRAAENAAMGTLLCEGWADQPTPVIDVLGDLMKVRGIWLFS